MQGLSQRGVRRICFNREISILASLRVGRRLGIACAVGATRGSEVGGNGGPLTVMVLMKVGIEEDCTTVLIGKPGAYTCPPPHTSNKYPSPSPTITNTKLPTPPSPSLTAVATSGRSCRLPFQLGKPIRRRIGTANVGTPLAGEGDGEGQSGRREPFSFRRVQLQYRSGPEASAPSSRRRRRGPIPAAPAPWWCPWS